MSLPAISPFASSRLGGSLDGSSRIPVNTLGQNDFLKLLVTKMTSQDPMNPQGDQEFIAQMAQFSALEQSKQMTGDIAALTANGMIGREVTINDGLSPTVEGVVSSIAMKDGAPQVVVGGQQYSLSKVTYISPYVPETETVLA
jgi:flagellar basal-body rod modification protein FlgD